VSELFATGRIVDLILALMVLEATALWVLRRLSGRGPPLARWVPTLLAGAFLLLALRLAMIQAAWQGIATALLLALLAHIADLLGRCQRTEST
jgi:hypothetical protein